jgi:hypothetical protein
MQELMQECGAAVGVQYVVRVQCVVRVCALCLVCYLKHDLSTVSFDS